MTELQMYSSLTARCRFYYDHLRLSGRDLRTHILAAECPVGWAFQRTCLVGFCGLSLAPFVSNRLHPEAGRATVTARTCPACDMRFASLENAILSHFEVGAGVCVP